MANDNNPQNLIAPTPQMEQPNTNDVSYLGKYQGQLNEMMAPYQAMAAKITSPYATMRPDSWLAQNHPKIAGALDNMFLTGAMTPGPSGPEGVGGGISRTFQGLVGAQQYRRQQAVMQALLPYQMMEPKLKALDTVAQAQERGAMGSYYRSRGESYDKALGLGYAKLDETVRNDDLKKYGKVLSSPEDRYAHDLHPFKDPKNPTIEEQKAVETEYENVMAHRRSAVGGGTDFDRIENMRNNPDPAIAAEGERRWKDIQQYNASISGARTGASEAARQPYGDMTAARAGAVAQLHNEIQRDQSRMPKFPTMEEWGKPRVAFGLPGHQKQDIDDYNEAMKPLKAVQDQFDADARLKYKKLNDNLKSYEGSRERKQGMGFDEYLDKMTNPDSSDSPKNSGSNWVALPPNR